LLNETHLLQSILDLIQLGEDSPFYAKSPVQLSLKQPDKPHNATGEKEPASSQEAPFWFNLLCVLYASPHYEAIILTRSVSKHDCARGLTWVRMWFEYKWDRSDRVVTKEDIVRKLDHTPAESLEEVDLFLDFIRYKASLTSASNSAMPAEHPAFGLWADRSDISSTVEHAGKLRRDVEERKDVPEG
jgi:hypothetical protein